MKADLNYSPSDVYETFARPSTTPRMTEAGRELEAARRAVMEQQQIGLTALYNSLHSEGSHIAGITRLRRAHAEIDEAVCEAYALDEEREPAIREFEERVTSEPLPSWREIDLRHGFYETRQGVRFTISPQARDIVLDKLLALNHYRHQQEVKQGLHRKNGRERAKITEERQRNLIANTSARSEDVSAAEASFDGLFTPPDALF